MSVHSNIEELKAAEQELKNHCLCFNYRFSKSGDLVVYLPLGYCVSSILVERKTKALAAAAGVEALEKIWKESFF